jgi:thymidylate synthase ThyX
MDFSRRIYPLDTRQLTEEQLAVVFAMTSRNPNPFDEIAKIVTEDKAADFHERWVLNYGHASVAEHAIIHMAVENISRIACDTLEDNRLASYTEKSSRYQILDQGCYHTPSELDNHPLKTSYSAACDSLFTSYEQTLASLQNYIGTTTPKRENEKDQSYRLRLRREAIDTCRFLLPAATLTNVGVTMNARSWEHAILKLLSSQISEEREIGDIIKAQGQSITPTLIKYADQNEYLMSARNDLSSLIADEDTPLVNYGDVHAKLIHYDPEAETKLVTSLLYSTSYSTYEEIWERVCAMDNQSRKQVISAALERLGPHDIPLRELEMIEYTFELVMDYGAYREFKRHRMQTYLSQKTNVDIGYFMPQIISDAGLEQSFHDAMNISKDVFHELRAELPNVADYVITHAHMRRVLCKINLRECYHLFKLRTQPTAHFTIRRVINQAMELAQECHPLLFSFLKLRSSH